MKKYKFNNDWSVLAALPYSFQISSKLTSHRLVDHQDDPDAEYPFPITIEAANLSSSHILMHTPRKYMRVTFFDDPDEPNAQIDMGLRTPDASLDFVSWLTLTNGIPKELVSFIYYIVTTPELMKDYEVPLFESQSNSNNNSGNNNPPPPPPPPKPTNNGTKKKRKYKLKVVKP